MRNVAAAFGIIAVASTNALATTHKTCGPWLEGRVVDRAGSPVTNAKLSIEGDLSSPDRERPTTRADGSYHLFDSVRTKCPSPTVLTVTVSAKGYEPKSETRRRSDDGWFHFEHVLDQGAK